MRRSYLRRHVGVDGRTRFYVTTPKGKGRKGRNEPLGVVTEEYAQAQLARVNEGLTRDGLARPVRIEAERALDAFLTEYRSQRAPDGTQRFYEDKLRLLFRLLSPLPMERWSPTATARVIESRPSWKAKRTVSAILAAARRFTTWAQGRGYRVPDFTKGLKANGAPRKVAKPPRGAGVAVLLAYARANDPAMERVVALAALGGMRLHDLRTVTWEEVDWSKADPVIRHLSKKRSAGNPIPISPALLEVLTRHRATTGIICRDLPVSDSSLLVRLKRLAKRAWKDLEVKPVAYTDNGLPSVSWHALRRALGTRMAEGGATVAEIGEALQHRQGSTTTLDYIHADSTRVRAAVEAAGRAMTTVLDA